MVLRGLVEEVPAPKSMATSHMRNPLHNFTFPSLFLNWGTQRRSINCTSAADGAGVSGSKTEESMAAQKEESEPEKNINCTSAADGAGVSGSKTEESMAAQKKESEPEKKLAVYVRRSKRRRSGEDEDGVAAVRQKLTLDLKNQADRLKEAILANEEEEPVKPWNLRKKQAECNSDKVKFHVELSKKEVEDDFMEMLGCRPPRRPNKRPKVVQKKLDDIFPGSWLTEITADRYKVVEKVRPSKKGKGSPSKKRKGKGKGSPSKKRKGKDK
ncbi:uncharacterized protein LOC133313361 [Gastrolobium bilobum]|uniref:uncharacterized protein LOC133313361 n=2 Tax=Gastrolobium bilobum TaxID=150636 RepID=UPI002AB1EF3C|nr:uncharacterized protein LOC133313361 [Gastrolobium bilobum]